MVDCNWNSVDVDGSSNLLLANSSIMFATTAFC